MEFELLTENLELKLSPDFYIEDITYPTNTIMGSATDNSIVREA